MVSMEELSRTKELSLFLWKYRNIKNEKSIDKEQFVKDLESLGPTFIKFGQLMCTQAPYLFPAEIEKALYTILDDVQPVSFDEIKQIVESELEQPLEALFSSFSEAPISSASLGQVHKATLKDGLEVAVKVQKPGVAEMVEKDLALLKKISESAEDYFSKAEDFQLISVMEQASECLLDELDYRKEAKNMKIFQKNLEEFPEVIVPEPMISLTTEKVLTMEFLDAKSLLKEPIPEEMDRNLVAKQLFKCFLKQILIDGIYHMDPHGGNVYIMGKQVVLLDYGMIGKVPHDLQEQFTKLLMYLNKAEEEGGVEILMRVGKKLDDFDYYQFKNKVGNLFASLQNKSIKSVSIGEQLLKLYNTAIECRLWLPPTFSIISKAIANLDQVCRKLSPSMDLNKVIEESSSEIMDKNFREASDKASILESALETAKLAKDIPFKLDFLLDSLSKGDFQFKMQFRDQAEFTNSVKHIANRITIGLILASMVIGSALIMNVPTEHKLFGYPALSFFLFLGAFVGAAILLFRILYDSDK